MDKEILYTKIEEYLNGNLSNADLIAFEKEVKENPSLAAEVALHKELESVLSDTDTLDFSDKMSHAFQSAKEEMQQTTIKEKKKATAEKTKVFSLRRVLALAASLLILAVAAFFLFQPSVANSNSYASLVAKNATYPSEMTNNIFNTAYTRGEDTKSIETQINTLWESAILAYKNKNYAQMLSALKQIENLDNNEQLLNQSKFYYFKGIGLLQSNKAKAAFNAFRKVRTNDEIYGKDAKWNQALACLLVEEEQTKEIGLELLNDIAEGNHPKKEKAKQLLQDLKKIK